MRYFIGQSDIDWSDSRWKYKCSRNIPLRRRVGFIGLFDRNLQKFIWFRIVRKAQNRYGYIVERNQPPIAYWKNAIKLESK